MATLVDAKYFDVARPGTLAERALIRARDQIFQDFIDRMRPEPGSSILDVGVSDVVNDGANLLERKYPHLHNVTACGIGECVDFVRAFPDVTFRRIEPNRRLPFEDGAFDIANSNAVLEHVGGQDNQIFFLRELLRVAKRVFVTVPNQFFPVEHHTAIPLLHFTDYGFKLACNALGKSAWTDPSNLTFLTRKKLWRLVDDLNANVAVGYTGLRLGPFSSNLFLALH